MRKYYNGIYDFVWAYNSQVMSWNFCNSLHAMTKFSVPPLISFYKSSESFRAISYLAAEDLHWYNTNCPEWDQSYNSFHKAHAYEILGRMCHLLQDMSVPAHVHNNSHAGTSGMYSDYYENNALNYYMWSADEIYASGKTFINPYNSWNDPLYYLMYFMNQTTDHFASGKTDGDNNFDATCPDLSQLISTLGLPTSQNQINDQNCSSMHNDLLPLAIRATAGLLYWFAKETGVLPTPLTNVYLTGTDVLYAGGNGIWYTTLQYGIAPFTYNWEIKYIDSGGYLQSFESVKVEKEKKEKEKKKDGDIIISLAPSNEWVPLGLNSDVLTRPHNPTDLRDYYLKCSVTDASGTTKTSNEWFIDITADPPPVNPPQTNTLGADNLKSEMNALSKENEITETPKSYSLEQNYPNPFNPTTRISYSIKEAGLVTLKVFDVLGREVATLVNEVKPAGRFEVEFNASNLPSGTYIYRLTSGNYQTINKMSLVK